MQFGKKQVEPSKPAVKVAEEIFKGVLSNCKKDENKFFLNTKNKNTGLISDCVGISIFLALKNTFKNIKIDLITSNIEDTIKGIIKHTEEDGYDISPILLTEETNMYFSKDNSQKLFYTESVAWVLTTLIQYRRAVIDGNISDNKLLMQNVTSTIRTCIEIIVDSATLVTLKDKEVKAGWGAMNGCTKPDLYFSASMIRAIANFANFTLGEYSSVDTELKDIININNKSLLNELGRIRKYTGEWLLQEYGKDLASKIINQKSPDDLSAIYNNYYIIEMLFFTNSVIKTNEFCEPIKDGKVLSKTIKEKAYLSMDEAEDDIINQQKIEHAIYFTRKVYDDNNLDNEQLNYEIKLENHEIARSITKLFGTNKMYDQGLKPLSLRINMLFACYINRFPDRKITEVYNSLIVDENRCEDGTFGNGSVCDLLFTVRATNSIIDYAYYEKACAKEVVITNSPGGGNGPKKEDGGGGPEINPIVSIDSFLDKMIEEKINSKISNLNNVNRVAQLNTSKADFITELNIAVDTSLQQILGKDKYKAADSRALGMKLIEIIFETINNNEGMEANKKKQFFYDYIEGFKVLNKMLIDNNIPLDTFFMTIYQIGTRL